MQYTFTRKNGAINTRIIYKEMFMISKNILDDTEKSSCYIF